jgi:hypothetical protein
MIGSERINFRFAVSGAGVERRLRFRLEAIMQRLIIPLLLLAAGCGGESEAKSAAQAQRVYFDSETKQAVAADMSPDIPALNPKTGRRTLMPALYCATCQQWHAAPPLAELQRNPKARMCPKCKGPLTADGPLPTATR